MKTRKRNAELDVDQIKSKPLTKQEEKGLSEFIKKLKGKKVKTPGKAA